MTDQNSYQGMIYDPTANNGQGGNVSLPTTSDTGGTGMYGAGSGLPLDRSGNPIAVRYPPSNYVPGQPKPSATDTAENTYEGSTVDPAQTRNDIANIFSQEIAAIASYYEDLKSQQRDTNASDLSRVRSSAAAGGVLGSPGGDTMLSSAEGSGQTALDKIAAEEANAESSVFGAAASEKQSELATSTQAQKDAVAYQQTKQQNQHAEIVQTASTTSLASLDGNTYNDLFDNSGFATPTEFEAFYNAQYLAAHKPNTQVVGNASTGYQLIQVDPTTGKIVSQQQITKPIAPKPVITAPGTYGWTYNSDTNKWEQTLAGPAKIQTVPFMSSTVSTGGTGKGGAAATGPGSSSDIATAGDPNKGGATAKDKQGNVFGLTASQVKSLDRASVPSDIWGDIAGIVTGTQPPPSTASGGSANSKYMLAIKNGLQALGYNLAKATLDWQAISTRFKTLNSTQQVRLSQAVSFAYDSLDIIETLENAWQGGQLPALNKVSLAAAAGGATKTNLAKPVDVSVTGSDGTTQTVHVTDSQQLATLLQAQINDITSELGTVYKGGNSSTDESLALAAGNLNASWSQQTLDQAINLARVNLQIRKNSISNAYGIPGNQYSPAQGGGSQQSDTLDTSQIPTGTQVTDANNPGVTFTYNGDGTFDGSDGNTYNFDSTNGFQPQ